MKTIHHLNDVFTVIQETEFSILAVCKTYAGLLVMLQITVVPMTTEELPYVMLDRITIPEYIKEAL